MRTNMTMNIEKFKGLTVEELKLQLIESEKNASLHVVGTPQHKHFHFQVRAIKHLLEAKGEL